MTVTDVSAAVGALSAAPFLGWWGLWAATAVRATRPRMPRPATPPARVDVVVPAHDEAGRVGALIESLRGGDHGRLGTVVVVADHCVDSTAEEAAAAGAVVLRRDDGAPGKPASLRAGIDLLRDRADRGDAVLLLDGDCVCRPGFVAAIAARMGPDDDAVQATYLLDEPDDGAVRSSLRLGFALRNKVRATGLDAFGLPVVLFGSGMAFRWPAIDALSFGDPRLGGTGDTRPVADDVLMAIDLVAAGVHPRFAADAVVVAPTPTDDRGLGAQRLRWEGGQLLMWRRMPRAVAAAARRGDWRALVAFVDWTAPPLVAGALLMGAVTAVAAAAALLGAAAPTVLVGPAVAWLLLATYLVVAVASVEGAAGVTRLVASAPRFVWWKAGLYRRHRKARAVG